MVAQWVVNDALRTELRAALTENIQQFGQDIILARSLGTLCPTIFSPMIMWAAIRLNEYLDPAHKLRFLQLRAWSLIRYWYPRAMLD
jgi:hypothetical protein